MKRGFCLLLIAIMTAPAVVEKSLATEVSSNSNAATGRGYVFSDDKTGRIGIGTAQPLATLDVSEGEVKIGSTGALCSNALAGTLRSTNSKLQFCDGASWRNVSLDKGP